MRFLREDDAALSEEPMKFQETRSINAAAEQVKYQAIRPYCNDIVTNIAPGEGIN